MMDPINAAGLALAIIPIVQSAANYNIGSLGMMLNRKAKDEKVADIYQRLNDELALLDTSLGRLIWGLTTLSDEDKRRLLKLDKDFWEHKTVTDAITARLGHSQEAFRHTVNEILSILNDIVSTRTLGLERSDMLAENASRPLYAKLQRLLEPDGRGKESGKDKESATDKSANDKEGDKDKENFRTRIKFTSKLPKLRKCLLKLTERIKYLERLLNSASASELANSTTVIPSVNVPPKKTGELARAVYESFAKLKTDDCAHDHEIMLCMNMPFDGDVDGLPSRMDMFISITHPESSDKWQDSSVHLDIDVQVNAQRVDSPVQQVRFSQASSAQPQRRKRRRSSLSEKLIDIESICNLTRDAHMSDVQLEMMLLKNDRLVRVHSSRRRLRVRPHTTRLSELLDSQRAKLRERRKLAVILAHALLHLKDSRWLEEHWTKEDVLFMSVDGGIDLSRPYLVSTLRNPENRHAGPSADLASQLHRSPPLLGLGIILLELGIAAPIETKRLQDDMPGGTVNVNTNYFTATRILEESIAELQDTYRSAVDACLDYKFVPTEGTLDFSDDGVRRWLYEHVVEPLERELKQGWGIKPEDLWLGGLGSDL